MRAPTTVDQSPLGPVDFDRVGIPGTAPFGPELWRGTSRSVAALLLQRLPDQPGSVVLARLQRQLLASAAVPDGPASEATRVIGTRLAKLTRLGATEELTQILAALPSGTGGEPLALARVELAFAADPSTACALALPLAEGYRTPVWLQIRAACHGLSGDARQAQLVTTALQERGAVDPLLVGLIESLGGSRGVPLDPPDRLQGWHVGLATAANRELPVASVAVASIPVARTLANASAQPAPVHLAAAERAARVGALDGAALRRVIEQSAVPAAEAAMIAGAARTDVGPRGRAQLFQAATVGTNPVARLEAARALLATARPLGLGEAYASALAPALSDISPAAMLGSHAADATRIYALAGDTARAIAWADHAQPATVWPILRLLGRGDGVFEQQILAWLDADRRVGGAQTGTRALMLFAVLRALGDEIPGSAWATLPGTADAVTAPLSQASLLQLPSAAVEGRFGETLALLLGLAGERAVGELPPVVAGALVDALRTIGQEPVARRLGLAILIGAGL